MSRSLVRGRALVDFCESSGASFTPPRGGGTLHPVPLIRRWLLVYLTDAYGFCGLPVCGVWEKTSRWEEIEVYARTRV